MDFDRFIQSIEWSVVARRIWKARAANEEVLLSAYEVEVLSRTIDNMAHQILEDMDNS